ncbi:MAG: aldehyde dehydrogenase family protein, partial [Cyanobacteria bacterium P01_G01_bin.4]
MLTALQTSLDLAPSQLLIGNEWVDSLSGKTCETINPATGEAIGSIAEAGAADVDRAVVAASAILPIASPVAGSIVSKVFPERLSTHSLPISSCEGASS